VRSEVLWLDALLRASLASWFCEGAREALAATASGAMLAKWITRPLVQMRSQSQAISAQWFSWTERGNNTSLERAETKKWQVGQVRLDLLIGA
jgi:hypothetical protein